MNVDSTLQHCRQLFDQSIHDPRVGFAFLVIVFAIAVFMVITDKSRPKAKIESIVERMNLNSKDLKLFTHKKKEEQGGPSPYE